MFGMVHPNYSFTRTDSIPSRHLVSLLRGRVGVGVPGAYGRQLDAAESAIHSLKKVIRSYAHVFSVMMDSEIRSGPGIASTLACGADFTFLGGTFMYGVCALGN